MHLTDIDGQWDLVIAGGGITGAGILREAVGFGHRVLLVEQHDFAWGTSSRSSKLVHGGLRYLKQGKLFLTRDSVREREYLIDHAPGLVEPLPLWVPIYRDSGPRKSTLGLGLFLYSMLAGKKQHTYIDETSFQGRFPHVRQKNLKGGFRYFDAQVDDSRLVLRLIQESRAAGALALNYTKAEDILRDSRGHVAGIALRDMETGRTREIETKAVINATGVWAETLHPSPSRKFHVRPLRGSHLVFSPSTLPVKEAVCFFHPRDNRPVFVIPWEGAVIYGTTDLDCDDALSREPGIQAKEVDYLMEALDVAFPDLPIGRDHIIAATTGIRPVLSAKKVSPSRESREHIVWVDKGLVTVTGGKLTTFRPIAWDTLKAARPFLPVREPVPYGASVFAPPETPMPIDTPVPTHVRERLVGRYGNFAREIVESAAKEDLELIPGTHTLWAELVHAAKHEWVVHLGDLLLRRVRIGILTPRGGEAFLDRARSLTAPFLPWDDTRWEREIRDYRALWKRCYSANER